MTFAEVGNLFNLFMSSDTVIEVSNDPGRVLIEEFSSVAGGFCLWIWGLVFWSVTVMLFFKGTITIEE